MLPVLLVEDDDICRDLTQMFLELAGFSVVPASNTKTAIEKISLQPLAAMVTDYEIEPGFSGWWLAEEIRKLEYGTSLPIYIYSSSDKISGLPKDLKIVAISKLQTTPQDLVQRIALDIGA